MKFGLCSGVKALGNRTMALALSQFHRSYHQLGEFRRHIHKQTSGKNKPEAKTAQFEDSRGQRKLLGGL